MIINIVIILTCK